MSALMKHLRLVWNTVEFCCHLGNSSHKSGTICSPGIGMWWPSKQGAGKARNRGEPFSRCFPSTEGTEEDPLMWTVEDQVKIFGQDDLFSGLGKLEKKREKNGENTFRETETEKQR